MDDDILFDTDQIRHTAGDISKDTNSLRSSTDSQLGKIDDDYKGLPGPVYSDLAAGLLVIKGFLNRSMDERDRVSQVLQQVAKLVDQQEAKFKKAFHIN